MSTTPSSHRESSAVLIVEDEPSIRELVADVLCNEGYPVLEAQDGLQAIHALERHRTRVGVVLLDMMLPHVDGVGVLRYLAERGANVPVVAMSASAQELAKATPAGAQTTLPKPFDLDRLLDTVARYCSCQS